METEPRSPTDFETTEMAALRAKFNPEITDEKFIELLTQYQQIGERQIDQLPDEQRARSQIYLILATAELRKTCNRDYHTDLEDARDYAEGIGDYDLADNIQTLLDAVAGDK